jgi:hypothetical protein
MSPAELDELEKKVTKGVKLAIRRLIEKTREVDGELVISKNGKVVKVKARDLPPE